MFKNFTSYFSIELENKSDKEIDKITNRLYPYDCFTTLCDWDDVITIDVGGCKIYYTDDNQDLKDTDEFGKGIETLIFCKDTTYFSLESALAYTLRYLLGWEDLLKDIKEKYDAHFSLHVSMNSFNNENEPCTMDFSLSEEIIAFLHNNNIKLYIDHYNSL